MILTVIFPFAVAALLIVLFQSGLAKQSAAAAESRRLAEQVNEQLEAQRQSVAQAQAPTPEQVAQEEARLAEYYRIATSDATNPLYHEAKATLANKGIAGPWSIQGPTGPASGKSAAYGDVKTGMQGGSPGAGPGSAGTPTEAVNTVTGAKGTVTETQVQIQAKAADALGASLKSPVEITDQGMPVTYVGDIGKQVAAAGGTIRNDHGQISTPGSPQSPIGPSPVENPVVTSPTEKPPSYFDEVSRVIQENPVLGPVYDLGLSFGSNGRAKALSDTLESAPGLSLAFSGGRIYEGRQDVAKAEQNYQQLLQSYKDSGLIDKDNNFTGTPQQYSKLMSAMSAADVAAENQKRLEDPMLGTQNSPLTMPLADWSKGASEMIRSSADSLIKGADSIVPAAAPLTHFVVGAGEGVAALVPFAALVPPAVVWTARNPGAAAVSLVPGLAMMTEGMVGQARQDLPRFGGNIAGMVVGAKVVGAGISRAPVRFSSVEIPTGIGEGTNRYSMLMAKAPWETWGASGRALVTLAHGEDFPHTNLFIGNRAFGGGLAQTNVKMPVPLDTMAVRSTPALEVYTKNLVAGSREINQPLYDLYSSYQATAETVKNPIMRSLYYRPVQTELFGELPTASASPEIMAQIIRTGNELGVVWTGSRANVRPFAAPYARGAEGFGGTMADFDVLIPSRNFKTAYERFGDIVKQESKPSEYTGLKGEKFSIDVGKGKFINAETFEMYPNVPVSRWETIAIKAIGGTEVRVPGPSYALSSKISGAMREGVFTQSAGKGLQLSLSEKIRAKDWPDLVSESRSIARDLYTPVKFDMAKILQTAKTSRAATAERLSNVASEYAMRTVPESRAMFGEFGPDILKGINRAPAPIVNINPEHIAMAGGAGAASALGIPPAFGLILGAVRYIPRGDELGFILKGNQRNVISRSMESPFERFSPRVAQKEYFENRFADGNSIERIGIRSAMENQIGRPSDRMGYPESLTNRRVEGVSGYEYPGRTLGIGKAESYLNLAGTGSLAFIGFEGTQNPLGWEYPGQVRSEAHVPIPRTLEPYKILTVDDDSPYFTLLSDARMDYPTGMQSIIQSLIDYPSGSQPINRGSPLVDTYRGLPAGYRQDMQETNYRGIPENYLDKPSLTTNPPHLPILGRINIKQITTDVPRARLAELQSQRELTWQRSKRKKLPARFLELFSFEEGIDTPIPRRFGLGGLTPQAVARNPKALFVEGHRGRAKGILHPEDHGPNNLFDILDRGIGRGKGRTRPPVWSRLLS